MSARSDFSYFQKQVAAPPTRIRRLAEILVPSNRFAIAGALVFGIVIPELFHPLLAHGHSWAQALHPFDPMLYASATALLLAHLVLRKTSKLPFVDAKVMVLPVCVISFAIVMIMSGFVFRRLSYYHFTTAYMTGVMWYSTLVVLRGRLGRPLVALVGIEQIDNDLLAMRVDWTLWHGTRLPRGADAIVYDSNRDYPPAWERFFARAVLRNIPVYDFDHFREMLIGRVRLRSKPELVFGQLLPSQPYLRIKRVLDFLAALVLLVPSLAIIGVAAILIRLDSPGPAIFRQKRIGYQGRIFTCYKLRTMRTGVAGPHYTSEADPRITRLGQRLRKLRVDELPQIFNVLKGEMSWIGPRPEALSLSRSYEQSIPYYRYRHSVRPGISGWAAVHQGNVALTDAATRKLEYDFYYIKYFTIWLDIVIVFMTCRTIVTGFGSR
ncbi:hypothetical protein MB02_14190 [Croceicoccus estronivorus]|uniref:sugar transferase n=1 Tax=Croceicoccus estronivorus TaxID=1172626 RepID=UPI0008368F1B|nr:sugar transferase [Croceicoccus estronivorus]OCC22914.1 hypothetical protein MB02_14190 [Croceicoccus estronivorus]